MSRSLPFVAICIVAFGCGAPSRGRSTPTVPAPIASPPESPASNATPGSTPGSTAPPLGAAPAAKPASAPAPAPAAPTITVARPAERLAVLGARRAALLAEGQRLGAGEVGYYMDVQEARLRQLVAEGYGVSRRDSALVVTIPGGRIFDINSARLLPSALATLSTLAKVLVEYRMTLITLNGFTDSTGEPQANQALSQARALSAARHLVAEGVSARRIVAIGHGAEMPIADNGTPEGRERNRRVELRIEPLKP